MTRPVLFLCVFGAILFPVLVVVAADNLLTWANPELAPSQYDLRRGQQVFDRRCARCHGLTPNSSAGLGPSLAQIGRVAATRRPGMSGAEYILESLMDPEAFKATGQTGEMPKHLVADLQPDDIRSLIAFLMNHGGQIDDLEIQKLRVTSEDMVATPVPSVQIDKSEVLAGEQLFRTKGECIACHELHAGPEYQILAPNVFHAGYNDLNYLKESILSPSKSILASYREATVVLENGKVLVGRQVPSEQPDAFDILSVDEKGRLTLTRIPEASIETDEDGQRLVQISETSPMPGNYESTLTAEEQHQLIALLRSLN